MRLIDADALVDKLREHAKCIKYDWNQIEHDIEETPTMVRLRRYILVTVRDRSIDVETFTAREDATITMQAQFKEWCNENGIFRDNCIEYIHDKSIDMTEYYAYGRSDKSMIDWLIVPIWFDEKDEKRWYLG